MSVMLSSDGQGPGLGENGNNGCKPLGNPGITGFDKKVRFKRLRTGVGRGEGGLMLTFPGWEDGGRVNVVNVSYVPKVGPGPMG